MTILSTPQSSNRPRDLVAGANPQHPMPLTVGSTSILLVTVIIQGKFSVSVPIILYPQAPRRENWQNRQDLQAVGKDLAKVGHLPMSPTSKPRQISGTHARGLCPNKSRATLPGENRWAEHCPCYAIAPNLRNRRPSKRHLVLDLKGRWPRTDCALHPPPPSPKHPWHLPQR